MPITHSASPRQLSAVIFDVDGVLVASPHEQAWRAALEGITDPARLTTELYQSQVAGKPRLAGALAALEALGVPDAAERMLPYADRKQRMIEELIEAHAFTVFPDALRFVQALAARGKPLGVASSSKNANQMMQMIPLGDGRTLLDLFTANVNGRELAHGKPYPDIFLLAASELAISPELCLVVEDAPAGIQAAHAGGMTGLGVARMNDADLLRAASAELIVTSLDEVDVDALVEGRLQSRTK
jgi:beta-phosphoglucomutase